VQRKGDTRRTSLIVCEGHDDINEVVAQINSDSIHS
jgi:5S rRNA maturation endonuclease (ribonuclease M5)